MTDLNYSTASLQQGNKWKNKVGTGGIRRDDRNILGRRQPPKDTFFVLMPADRHEAAAQRPAHFVTFHILVGWASPPFFSFT